MKAHKCHLYHIYPQIEFGDCESSIKGKYRLNFKCHLDENVINIRHLYERGEKDYDVTQLMRKCNRLKSINFVCKIN